MPSDLARAQIEWSARQVRRKHAAFGLMLLGGLAGLVVVSRATATPVLRIVALDRPDGLALDAPLGRAFVIGVDSRYRGYAATLDTASGALLHTASLGSNPTDMAIDQRTGHAFVGGGGGPVQTLDPWGWVPRWLRWWTPFLPAAS